MAVHDSWKNDLKAIFIRYKSNIVIVVFECDLYSKRKPFLYTQFTHCNDNEKEYLFWLRIYMVHCVLHLRKKTCH